MTFLKQRLTAAAFFALAVLAWHCMAQSGLWSSLILPPPLDVARYVYGALQDGSLIAATLVTVRRLLLGYALGICVGLPLGLMTARWKTCGLTLGVVALGLQTLPSVCWVPLALIWFGQSETAMLFVVVMGSMWSVLIATDNGVKTVPPIYMRAAQTMGSKSWHTWLKVILPASLPFIVSGMKQGWAFAWRSLMAAEIFVTVLSGLGLGQLLQFGRDLHAMDQVVGVMLVIIAIGLLADKFLFSPWENFLHRRWGTSKS